MEPLANNLLIASIFDSNWMYAVPLIIVISLVYGATRDEVLPGILWSALRFGRGIVVFMFVIFVVLWITGMQL